MSDSRKHQKRCSLSCLRFLYIFLKKKLLKISLKNYVPGNAEKVFNSHLHCVAFLGKF